MSVLGYVNSEIGTSTRCDLPEDICGLVCDAVRDLPRAVAASTLLSLSLVSRSWAAAAQSALHHDPFLSFDAPDTVCPRTFERLSALLQTLVARPDLSRSVRKFDLGCYTTRCQTEARVDRRRVSKLSVDLVAASPALKSISLPFVTQADKPYLIDALRKLELLETLIIGEGTSSPDPWVINVDIGIKDAWGCARWFREDFVALSGHWPRLRRLVLEARVRARDTDDEHGVPWELEEFRLDLQRHGRLGFRHVDLLLAGSRNGSLKRFHVKEHQLADDALAQVVEHYGSNLKSLTTLTADHFTRHDELFSAIAAFCPSLRCVHLSTPVYDLLPCLRHLLQLPRLRRLTLATVLAPATCSPDLDAELVALVHNAPSLEELNIALGTHHVTDRGNTIAFARVLAEASRTLASSHSKATLTLLPTWGSM
ncbi:hypothetical protein RHOSPDRAFT_36604 [Rhodotorula sp. JG-1b]|nr:hypothetical protein RHOSPDRAFT_36604 [Rhodotorula sp. JG-1b]